MLLSNAALDDMEEGVPLTSTECTPSPARGRAGPCFGFGWGGTSEDAGDQDSGGLDIWLPMEGSRGHDTACLPLDAASAAVYLLKLDEDESPKAIGDLR